ncbi:hypothetical protein UFOVP1382_183 [uncultured Caudovirales phage]|uniref:Uncharacterized protein n=1 Tax=uncultured Caudovirales phage TaxID=2100421 RepID=A0A6J5S5C0_9CAUD|nr:hypothetical protein UFOVP1382_183 [uncultured Caudovirales phage]
MSVYRRTKPKFSVIRALPCFAEIDRMAREGYAGLVIAKRVQASGHASNMEVGKLAAEINAFRRDLSAVELLEHTKPALVIKAEEKLAAALDEAEEVAALYAIQRTRVLNLHEVEKKNPGVHNRLLGNEVRVAAELLRTSVAIKKDVGFGTRVEKTSHDADREPLTPQAQEVMSDPQKRQRVLDALKQIRDAEVLPFRKQA